jgi:hypothetical protein
MLRSLTSLVLAVAVLLPGMAWPSAAAASAAEGHACCLRNRAMRGGCRTSAITCCPAPTRGRQGATPPASAAGSTTSLQPLDGLLGVPGVPTVAARTVAFGASALARANAPPAPLYLRHLTLLV